MHVECADTDIVIWYLPTSAALVGNMAAYSSLTTLLPIQSQLDYVLEDTVTHEEKENLVYQYLQKLDENEDLNIPDFEKG